MLIILLDSELKAGNYDFLKFLYAPNLLMLSCLHGIQTDVALPCETYLMPPMEKGYQSTSEKNWSKCRWTSFIKRQQTIFYQYFYKVLIEKNWSVEEQNL